MDAELTECLGLAANERGKVEFYVSLFRDLHLGSTPVTSIRKDKIVISLYVLDAPQKVILVTAGKETRN